MSASKSSLDGQGGETSYAIEGFRSLSNFDITLQSGLNILVGPNGSGKTNFIEFLDFLDRLIGSGAASAVASVGGISRVFSQETRTRQSLKLNASVCGIAYISEQETQMGPTLAFRFDYKISLAFNKAASALFISSEIVKFYHLSSIEAGLPSWTTVGVIGVSRSSRSEDFAPKLRIGGRLLEDHSTNPLAIKPRYLSSRTTSKDILDRAAFEIASPDESILISRSNLPALDAVRLALTRGRVFNVIPDRVREPEDITRPPGIARDGAGLASTLFHLQEMKRGQRRRRPFAIRRTNPRTLDVITNWTKLVLRELSSLSVVQDPHSGKYIGYVGVGDDGLKIPFRSVSDGTLKWLSLVTMVLTTGAVFSLEEPENFLHPKMQKYLIELIREEIASRGPANHCIISTHSETVLNQCSAQELLLFKFSNGTTTCQRLRNAGRVEDEINSTGFGLGHYYASNALS